MAAVTKEDVLQVLKRIAAPDGRGNLVSSGIATDVVVNAGRVMFSLQAEPSHLKTMEQLRAVVEKQVAAIPGVERALVSLTAERAPQPAAKPPPRGNAVPGVRHIVAVASGKGGVGKSTTAVNLALAFKANGLRVAVLDADVYGPSMPTLFGISGKPRAGTDGKTLEPMRRFGVEVMSIGFLVPEETAMIWRGPMVMSAINQLLREVSWGETDIMIVDMPPGTGDAQLTLAQQTPLSGAVIVSTPQDLALIDARRGISMFQKVNVPVLGIVENMSYFTCTKCGERHDIFAHGGARAESARLGVPFLGEIPLDIKLRQHSDEGEPLVATEPEGTYAILYREIAAQVWAAVSGGAGTRPSPKIVVET